MFTRTKSGILPAFASALPSVVAVTVAACFTYGTGHVIVRAQANEPVVQMARDGAAALSAGFPATAFVPAGPQLDAASALGTFVAVYDDKLVASAASASLGDRVPAPPDGVFAAAKARGEDHPTWAPRPGLRFATDVVPWSYGGKSGFVLAARSLKQAEALDDLLLRYVALGWVASLLAVVAASLLANALVREK